MALLADLHNHSCLSPCASLEMSPRRIASTAASRGISLLALTDHNSALNAAAFQAACREISLGTGHQLLPLFGMEATTREEVHVLCLFGALEAALSFSEKAYALLPPIRNDPEKLGDQIQVDEEECIIGEVELYLGSALDLGIDEIGAMVETFGGLAIPAHIDRPAFSMTSQLGFVVDGPWAALECTRLPTPVDTHGYPLTTSSDAHYPEHIGRRPCELEASLDLLQPDGPGTPVSMAALKAALALRPRQ